MPAEPSVILADRSSSLTATFVPTAGMICTSLADGDVEFLGQRRGLDAYVNAGKTMGIPLLYPWANRLGDTSYEVDGTVVTLTPGANGVRLDGPGIPIHGVLAAYPGWVVTERSGDALTAVLDFTGTPQLLASFPFPHSLIQHVTLADRTLSVTTTVLASSAAAVPVCFGYHPYFVLPGVPRAQWSLTTPAMRRLPVDSRGLPTGDHESWPAGTTTLGATTYDDGFDQLPEGATFVLAGGEHRIALTFETGYPATQVFAPPTDDVIAVEPMAAPTDALRTGNHRFATPGRPDVSRFSIRIG